MFGSGKKKGDSKHPTKPFYDKVSEKNRKKKGGK